MAPAALNKLKIMSHNDSVNGMGIKQRSGRTCMTV